MAAAKLALEMVTAQMGSRPKMLGNPEYRKMYYILKLNNLNNVSLPLLRTVLLCLVKCKIVNILCAIIVNFRLIITKTFCYVINIFFHSFIHSHSIFCSVDIYLMPRTESGDALCAAILQSKSIPQCRPGTNHKNLKSMLKLTWMQVHEQTIQNLLS